MRIVKKAATATILNKDISSVIYRMLVMYVSAKPLISSNLTRLYVVTRLKFSHFLFLIMLFLYFG